MPSQGMSEMVAERISKAVTAHQFAVRTGKTVQVSISVGIACFPADGETTEELLTMAARNMQRDKHSRKNMANLAAMPTPVRMDRYT